MIAIMISRRLILKTINRLGVAQKINRLDDYERRRLIVMQIIAISIIIEIVNRHDY